MKIVTFNIRCDYNQDGENNFCYRRDLIARKIHSSNADVICFQEVLPHVLEWLKEELSEYVVVGCGRDEHLEDETTAIAYRKIRYNLMSMNTVWLSKTPYVAGSRYEEQSICPRTVTSVLLHDLETKKVIRIYNTHLDHEGEQARYLGVKQIIAQIKEENLYSDAPIIVTGDFNAEPDSKEIQYMQEHSGLLDATKEFAYTYHEYGKEASFCKIDYIYVSKQLSFGKAIAWDEQSNGVYLSDHYPLEVEVEINE